MTANINSKDAKDLNDAKMPSVLRAAWLIAVVTIVSKIIGFIRDIVIADCYGASTVSDAYFYAYQLPALSIILLGGVGGPFHSATVAVFSKIIPSLKEKANPEVNFLFISCSLFLHHTSAIAHSLLHIHLLQLPVIHHQTHSRPQAFYLFNRDRKSTRLNSSH